MLHLKMAQLLGELRQGQRSKAREDTEDRRDRHMHRSLTAAAKYIKVLVIHISVRFQSPVIYR